MKKEQQILNSRKALKDLYDLIKSPNFLKISISLSLTHTIHICPMYIYRKERANSYRKNEEIGLKGHKHTVVQLILSTITDVFLDQKASMCLRMPCIWRSLHFLGVSSFFNYVCVIRTSVLSFQRGIYIYIWKLCY